MSSTSQSGGGIGFCGMLVILFIGLKLTHFIDWSWFWVLSPIWIPVGLVGIFVGFCLIMAVLTGQLKK